MCESPVNKYMLKVSNQNTRKSSKLTITTPERRQWRRSFIFIVNFERISNLFLVLTLKSPKVLFKKDPLKNFAKIHRKTPVLETAGSFFSWSVDALKYQPTYQSRMNSLQFVMYCKSKV